jgi:hypothetical protein
MNEIKHSVDVLLEKQFQVVNRGWNPLCKIVVAIVVIFILNTIWKYF